MPYLITVTTERREPLGKPEKKGSVSAAFAMALKLRKLWVNEPGTQVTIVDDDGTAIQHWAVNHLGEWNIVAGGIVY